jgi:hypothetical protein
MSIMGAIKEGFPPFQPCLHGRKLMILLFFAPMRPWCIWTRRDHAEIGDF